MNAYTRPSLYIPHPPPPPPPAPSPRGLRAGTKCIDEKEKNRRYAYGLKPHSHSAGVATVHPDAGQPVYRDAPGHIS